MFVCPRERTFSGKPAGALVAVASLEIVDPASDRITVGQDEYGPEDFRRCGVGELERILVEKKLGVHLFVGPAKLATMPGSLGTLDARQLEALRALGYTGAKKEPGQARPPAKKREDG